MEQVGVGPKRQFCARYIGTKRQEQCVECSLRTESYTGAIYPICVRRFSDSDGGGLEKYPPGAEKSDSVLRPQACLNEEVAETPPKEG